MFILRKINIVKNAWLKKEKYNFNNMQNLHDDDDDSWDSEYSPLSSISSSPEKMIRNRTFEYINSIPRRPMISESTQTNLNTNSPNNFELVPIDDEELQTVSLISETAVSDSTYEFDEIEDRYFEYIGNRKSIFSIIYIFSVVISFLVGLNGDNSNINMYFSLISRWPKCIDQRNQVWKFFSSTLVHNETNHLIGNLIVLIPTLIYLEKIQRSIYLFILFIFSSLHIGFVLYLTVPYAYVIGCSGFAFTIIGCIIADLILNYNTVDSLFCNQFFVLLLCLLLIFLEVFSYITSYSENVSYLAHWVGFLSGLIGGISIFDVFRESKFKTYIKIFSTLIYYFGTLILFYFFIENFPPLQSYNERFQKIETINCCYEWFKYRESNLIDSSLNPIESNYSCPYIVDYSKIFY